jgi:hypothetical protein
MDDVIKIISWGGVIQIQEILQINGASRDLYFDYSNICVDEIAQSNELYCTYVTDQTFIETLKLALDHI